MDATICGPVESNCTLKVAVECTRLRLDLPAELSAAWECKGTDKHQQNTETNRGFEHFKNSNVPVSCQKNHLMLQLRK